MNTIIVSKEDIDKMIYYLDQSQVIAFPTETVYGVAVKYGDSLALKRLMEAKNRDYSKAITLMLSHKDDIKKYAYVNDRDQKIIDHFMPGKITLIFKKKDSVDSSMTNGKETIGIRIPDDKFVLNLIDHTGPLLVTSANLSGHSNTTTTNEVLSQLSGRISLVVDGQTNNDKASTVLDLSHEELKVLREGDISLKEIEEVIK